jgi:hypothetical protein
MQRRKSCWSNDVDIATAGAPEEIFQQTGVEIHRLCMLQIRRDIPSCSRDNQLTGFRMSKSPSASANIFAGITILMGSIHVYDSSGAQSALMIASDSCARGT